MNQWKIPKKPVKNVFVVTVKNLEDGLHKVTKHIVRLKKNKKLIETVRKPEDRQTENPGKDSYCCQNNI